MNQKEKNIAILAIMWTLDNYADIVFTNKYGKDPTYLTLVKKFEKYVVKNLAKLPRKET